MHLNDEVYADFNIYKTINNILYNKVYPGPTDGTAKITSTFTEPIATRYIRIRPVEWLVKAYFGHNHWMSLRMELLGCKGTNFKFSKYSFLRFGYGSAKCAEGGMRRTFLSSKKIPILRENVLLGTRGKKKKKKKKKKPPNLPGFARV